MRKVITYGLWGLTFLSFLFGCSVVFSSGQAMEIFFVIGFLLSAFGAFIFFFILSIAVSRFFSWLEKKKQGERDA